MSPARPRPESHSRLTDDDLYLWNEGSHFRLYEKLGATSRRRWHPVRGVGPQCRSACPWSVTGMVGTRRRIRCAHGGSQASGRDRSVQPGRERHTSSTSSTGTTSWTRRTRSGFTTRRLRRRHPRSGISATTGATAIGWRSAPPGTPWTPRSASTRCISAPGGGTTTGTSSLISNWRRSCRLMSQGSGSPTSSCSR